MVLFLGMSFSAGAQPADEEVPVNFDGDEEVRFDEQTDQAVSDRPPLLTEHEYETWVLVFPLLCLALLAWNVRWRNPDQEDKR